MDKNTKITIAISVAVLVIFIGSLSFLGGKKSEDKQAVEVATSTDSEISANDSKSFSGLSNSDSILMNKTDGLSVVDQLADEYVAFSGVTFEDDTWVAVYEDKDGKPSNLIGTGLFFGGITEGVSPLLRGTVAGSKYYVTLIKDNGDRVFNITEDRPQASSPIVSFIAK